MRAPFLQGGGNKQFEMLFEANFTYDSTMPVFENSPPFWPYTLDYAMNHECMIAPCPTKSFPGIQQQKTTLPYIKKIFSLKLEIEFFFNFHQL
jgi:hypothetical protein